MAIAPRYPGGRMGAIEAAEPDSQRKAKPQTPLESRSAPGKEVVPRVLLGTLGNTGKPGSLLSGASVSTRPPSLLAHFPGCVPGQEHTFPRHLDLRSPRTPGEQLDLGSVLVPRRKIEGREPGSGAEDLVHQTDALEELGPVDGGHPTHAGDDVADGDICRGLGMVFLSHHLIGRRPLGAQLLVEPDQGRHDRRSLVTKPLDELHGERAAQLGRHPDAPEHRPRAQPADRSGPAGGPPARRPGLAPAGSGRSAATAAAGSPPGRRGGGWRPPRAPRW